MTRTPIEDLRTEIMLHESNAALRELGYSPLFVASPAARIVIVGQAPGVKAQTSRKVWNDASGLRLKEWLNMTDEVFRDDSLIAHIPMDFYYPGKGKSGDLPPRKDFARLWHPQILRHMPNVELMVLIGRYAQEYYLGTNKGASLATTVRNYESYLPRYFPLVHPSPRNFRWLSQNAWFEAEVVPRLQARVNEILYPHGPSV